MPVGVLSLGAWTTSFATYSTQTVAPATFSTQTVAPAEDDVSISTTSYPTKATFDRDSTSLVTSTSTSTSVDDSGGLDTDFDAADDPTIVEADRELEDQIRKSTSDGNRLERTLCEIAEGIAAVAERVPLSKRIPTSSSGDSTTVERQLTSDEIRIIEQQAEAQAGGSAGDGSVTLLETTTTLGPDGGAEGAKDAESGSSRKRKSFPWWLIAAGGAGLLFVATRG